MITELNKIMAELQLAIAIGRDSRPLLKKWANEIIDLCAGNFEYNFEESNSENCRDKEFFD